MKRIRRALPEEASRRGRSPDAWLTDNWLVERLGMKRFLNSQLYHRVPRRVNPLDFLGIGSLFVFINQVITGIILATWYSPSVPAAYDDMKKIAHQIPLGWLVQNLHYWGANLMVVLVFFHMLRVFYIGAYRKPRELTWIAGVLLLGITILFAFTGYLLPWDQQAYWASMVGTWMPFYAPVVGTFIVHLIRGGDYITSVTLSRFYAIHVLVLPALFLMVFGLHFYMVLAKQLTMVEEARDLPKRQRGLVTFFPTTVFQMMMFLVIIGCLLLYISMNVNAPLLAIADPLNKAHYNPVPIWFFFSIYQLLKYIPPVLDPLGIIGLPLIAGVVLLALPFIDRIPRRTPSQRKTYTVPAAVVVAAVFALTYLGAVNQGIPGGSSQVVANPTYSKDILPILQADCAQCHSQAVYKSMGTPMLLSYQGINTPYKGQKLIVPGDPAKSILYLRITGQQQPQMPLGGAPLPKNTIATIANWIKQGAKQ